MKKIIYILAVSIYGVSFSQINLMTSPNIKTLNPNSSVFLDASTSYDPTGTGENNTGKGLLFPQVDLTTFEFESEQYAPGILPTYYDGMIVYNVGQGETVAEASKGGVKVTVDKGFYYFFNPEGRTEGNIEKGKWVKIADTNELVAGINNGKFWTLKGNEGTKEAQLQDKDGGDYTITDGNFIGTTDEKSLTFATNNIARLTIGATGETLSEQVGTNPNKFDFILKVYGRARFSEGIVTKASTYPDYVFDNYFTGKSDVNPDYKFKKLNEVEAFIKENNHLPGVTKIDDLAKTESGYEVDNTQLSIQTLEKVEELYLHLIEQQKEIQALKAQIAELKK